MRRGLRASTALGLFAALALLACTGEPGPSAGGVRAALPRVVLPRLSVDGPWISCTAQERLTAACVESDASGLRDLAAVQGLGAHRDLLRAIVIGRDLQKVADRTSELAAGLRRPIALEETTEVDRDSLLVDLSAGRLLLALGGERAAADASQAAEALDELSGASSATGTLLASRVCFNTALALEILGLLGPADEAWAECLPELEEGWREEARERRLALRETLLECEGGEAEESSPECLDREYALKIGLRHLAGWTAGLGAGATARVESVFDAAPRDASWRDVRAEAQRRGDGDTAAGIGFLAAGVAAFDEGDFGLALTELDRAASSLEGSAALTAITRLHTIGARLLDDPAASRRRLENLVEEATRKEWGWVACYGSRLLTLLSARTQSALLTLPIAESAYDTAARFGYRAQMVDLGLLLAETYNELHRASRSWNVAARALREAYRLGTTNELFFAVNLAAGIAEKQRLDRLAHRLQTEAIRLGATQPLPSRANAHLWRAVMRTRLGDSDGARRDLERAASLAAGIADPHRRRELEAEIELARAATEVGSAPEAAVERLSAVMDHLGRDSLDNLLRALELRAEARLALGLREAAAEDLRRALGLAARRLEEVSGESGDWALGDRVAFQGRLERLARMLVGLELASGRPWAALVVNESWKELFGSSGAGALARGSLDADLAADLARRLDPGQALAAFGLADEDVVAWVIGSDAGERRWLRLGRHGELVELLERYDAVSQSSARRQTLAALHEWLIEPLDLAGVSTLTIVPHPGLEGIPFPSLVSSEGRYLLEEMLLRFSLSARHPGASRAEAVPASPPSGSRLHGKGMIVYADEPPLAIEFSLPPLPAAVDEISAVRSAAAGAAGDTVELVGPAASRASVLEALPRMRWAHLIGHTTPGPSSAIPPALLLGGPREESWLTADDVAALDLAELRFVVLSTCSSAVRGTEGWMSRALLARAFLDAGARGVVASLAPVDDRESADLFRLMYRRLAAGEAVAPALRSAQTELLAASGGEPGTWMSYIYLGTD